MRIPTAESSTSEATDVKPTPETPAVVISTNGVSLADRLRLNELPLATTPGGKQFCLKALHPSEHTVKSARVPGGNENSVAICCDMIHTVPISGANSDVVVTLAPSIVCPACVEVDDSLNPKVFTNMYNAAFAGTAIVGATHTDTQNMLNYMNGKISKYRITSESVTVELIAPALADQGTVTAAQFNLPPRTTNFSECQASSTYTWSVDGYMYPDPPSSAQWLLGTSAYTSKAREGAYLPLRINKFKWMDFNDTCLMMNVPQSMFFTNPRWQAPLTQNVTFPYHENRTTVTQIADIPATPKLCGSNFGMVHMAGLAANTAVRVRVRQVVEIVAPPSTTYAPLLEAPLPPDDHAMLMYQEVSARMADAYPASYNDLGKLFGTIKKVASSVMPYVAPALDIAQKAGGPIGAAATAIKGAAPIAKNVVDASKQFVDAAKPAAQAVVQTVRRARQRRNRPKKKAPQTPARK